MAITTATTRCKSNGVRDVPGMGGSNEKSSTWLIILITVTPGELGFTLESPPSDGAMEPPSLDGAIGAIVGWCD
eukprot:CAMPEP_0201960802 /NCGR_PEP_ID=MMETSP0904-20121228/7449_1 /ASSEMBLY_ACC=CAM_ASM_000553 /TAXON_ID=420261 /ORGANISM="Thalassiosira antarctica, Strain CCMP982" /LENGTH=73 /DNA_ID=CAMNT_0048506851 /DNA_START=285 /DNA_END=507 /DNA_ORIENTATION=+